MAKTVTGKFTSSPGPTTLGNVANAINGIRTGTVFSVFPKAPSLPAITITRTEPTY